jgi:hypothetical protein
VSESLIADPPDALDPTQHPSQSSVAVEVRPAGRTLDGALWSGRVRFMEPGRASSIIVIALTKAAQEPFGPARLLEDARRFAEWIGGLQGLPWYRDERGKLVLPRERHRPTRRLQATQPGSRSPISGIGTSADQWSVSRLPAQRHRVRRAHEPARCDGRGA